MVQAGERGRVIRLFEASGTVAIGGGADAAGEDKQAAFQDLVRPGDIVVTSDGPTSQLLIGEVTGQCEEREDKLTGRPQQVRPVEWYGRYGRDDRTILSPSMEAATRLPHSLLELTPPEAWLAFAAHVRERPPLAAAEPRPMKAATATKAPRASRAAAKVVPKVVAPTHRKCPSCQMQKMFSQFRAGSEHCVDCRERLGED